MYITVYEFYGDYVIGGLFANKEDITAKDMISGWSNYQYYIEYVPMSELSNIQFYLKNKAEENDD